MSEKLKRDFIKLMVIIPLAYFFYTINVPLWANILLTYIIASFAVIGFEKLEAIQEENARKSVNEEKEKREPLYVRVIKSSDGSKIANYRIPDDLKVKFIEEFGGKHTEDLSGRVVISKAILEDTFNNFILDNYGDKASEYFAEIHQKDMQGFEATATPERDYHAINTQRFHMTYYRGNELIVIDSINGMPITKDDKNNFKHWVRQRKDLGEKVYEADFNSWLAEYNIKQKEKDA